MTKKGKFKFASFLVEDHLIFFKDKKKSTMVAFTVLYSSNFKKILPILIKMLEKRYFEYFSWQITVDKDKKDIFIINFRDAKAGIIKAYNLIKQELNNLNFNNYFLEKDTLKTTFFKILSKEIDSKLSIVKSLNAIIIQNPDELRVLSIFELDIGLFAEQENLYENLINYLRDLGKKFLIYFNFSIDRFNLISNYGILIAILNQKTEKTNLDELVNQFFHNPLLNKLKIKLKQTMCILWRKTFPSSRLLYKTSKFFLDQNLNYDSNSIIDDLLVKFDKHKINYHQINEKILFIEDHILFILIEKLDLQILSNLLEKYYSKYKVMMLFLNEGDYYEVTNVDKISKLNNLTILRISDLVGLNYNIFKMN